MTLELDRAAPLYEATLGVQLVGVGDGGSHVEGERVLTVRLLEGSRPMASGAGATPARTVVQQRIFADGAASPPPRGGEGPSGRERVLHLELADAADPYFLYALDVGEGDFHELRREHALLVDFLSFPTHFVDLLGKCEGSSLGAAEAPGAASRFGCALERGAGTPGTFAVVEANAFKRVTHVALKLKRGDDADVKAYLAGRLAQTLAESAAHKASFERTAADLAASRGDVAELAAAKDALEREHATLECGHASSHREREASHREALAREVTALQAAHGDELRGERARHAAEAEALKTDLAAKAAENTQLAEALAETERKAQALQRELHDARRSGGAAEQRADAAAKSAKLLQAERDAAAADARGLELRLASLGQRASDSEATVARADALREASESARRSSDARHAEAAELLKKREDQLGAASGEIARGNAIIERLSEANKHAAAKLRLKADVIKQQERRVGDAAKDRDDAAHGRDLAKASEAREREKRELAETALAAAERKLADAADLLENNQGVIKWLNDELAAHRLGTRVVSPAAYAPPEPPSHADDLGVSRDAAADYFAAYQGAEASDHSFASSSSRPSSSRRSRDHSFLHEANTPPPVPPTLRAAKPRAAPNLYATSSSGGFD